MVSCITSFSVSYFFDEGAFYEKTNKQKDTQNHHYDENGSLVCHLFMILKSALEIPSVFSFHQLLRIQHIIDVGGMDVLDICHALPDIFWANDLFRAVIGAKAISLS